MHCRRKLQYSLINSDSHSLNAALPTKPSKPRQIYFSLIAGRRKLGFKTEGENLAKNGCRGSSCVKTGFAPSCCWVTVNKQW